MGTKNNPGKFDCYANAEPDEPMFVLLGRDRDAPALVELWALLRERAGEDASKVAEARECAAAMATFRQLRALPHAIFVNGVAVNWYKATITYADIALIAHPQASPERIWSVVWRCGDRSGTLAPGETAPCATGAKYSCYDTSNA